MRRTHHSHYVTWCELGRTAFMRERGISCSDDTARTERVCTSANGRPRRLPPQVREALETLAPGARASARGRFS